MTVAPGQALTIQELVTFPRPKLSREIEEMMRVPPSEYVDPLAPLASTASRSSEAFGSAVKQG